MMTIYMFVFEEEVLFLIKIAIEINNNEKLF